MSAFAVASATLEKLTEWLWLARNLSERGEEEDAVTMLRGGAVLCEMANCFDVVESAEPELALASTGEVCFADLDEVRYFVSTHHLLAYLADLIGIVVNTPDLPREARLDSPWEEIGDTHRVLYTASPVLELNPSRLRCRLLRERVRVMRSH